MTTAASPSRVRRGADAAARNDARGRLVLTLTVLLAVALAVTMGVALSRDPAASPAAAAAPTSPGEVNDMGMPVIPTPGAADGTVAAGGVEVAAANWDLGTVPLNVAVRPTWTLRNTGYSPVSLGEPRPEVREGCCPGPLTVEDRTLEPGASTTLTFELSMHPGMDGWHDLAVHVPVSSAAGDDILSLNVVGDFRD